MPRSLVSALLIGMLVLSVTTFNCSCSHRGSAVEGPVAEAWVARFKSPGACDAIGQAIALDSLGNICVAGTTGACKDNAHDNILTVKYDGTGKRLWLATYDGPVGGPDRAAGISVDAEGNIYVVGSTTIEKGYSQEPGKAAVVIMKYDGSGNQLWVATHEGTVGGGWGKGAMTMDDAGNVYLTGGTKGTEGYDVFFTVKYDTDGHHLWDSSFSWSEPGDAVGVAIALDKQGNVYATGSTSNTSTAQPEEFKSAIITIKYSSSGEELWTAEYDSGVLGFHGVSGIAIDSLGDVCVTGDTGRTAEDYVTIKYDSDGKQLWAAQYNGPDDNRDETNAICLDSLDNVYITGSGTSENSDDYATVKYDKDGNEVWVARYDGPGHGSDIPYAIAVDSSGNSYITGQSYYAGPEDFDCCTIKYDAGGHQVWVARYNGPASYNDYAEAIVVDNSGNVYVTGQSKNTDDDCCCLIAKYVPV